MVCPAPSAITRGAQIAKKKNERKGKGNEEDCKRWGPDKKKWKCRETVTKPLWIKEIGEDNRMKTNFIDNTCFE